MKTILLLAAAMTVITSQAGAASAPAPIPSGPKEVESDAVRRMCTPLKSGSLCVNAPYESVSKLESADLPAEVESAFNRGYGTVEVSMKLTAGPFERQFCGGFLADDKDRLIITARHCLPAYLNQLSEKNIKFHGVPARYIASISDADLALLQIDAIPAGMQELKLKEAVVEETIYGRSLQVAATTESKEGGAEINSLFFMGPVTYYGIVESKGSIGLYRFSSPSDGTINSDLARTSYQVLRAVGEAEPGFSGSPAYNRWGEVVGIFHSTGKGKAYVISSKNFPELLSMYKK